MQQDQNIAPQPVVQPQYVRILHKFFPFMIAFGDVIIFVFEFIFLNTLIQLLLSSVSFIRQAKGSSVNVCFFHKICVIIYSYAV